MTAKAVDRALVVASKGWRVFPCNGKAALVPWKRNASANPRAVRQMWRRHPDANVGIALPEGTIVVDVDDLAAFTSTGLALPDAPGQATPGGGFHRLFSTNGHSAAQTVKATPGIDTRVGGKGYIVAWDPDGLPSVGTLPEAPDWVYGERRSRKVSVSFPGIAEPIREGERDRALTSLAGTMRDRGMSEDAIRAALAVENAERCVPPLSDQDVRRIAHSVARYTPEHAETIVNEDDLEAMLGLRAMASVEEVTPEPLLLGRYVPDGATVLYGPGGIGKGRLASQDAAELTRGGACVLIVDYEDHEQEWRVRLADCRADLTRVFRVAPHATAWQGPKGTIVAHAPLLRRAALHVGASFVVIDSAIMALPGVDPSDPRAPQLFSSALQEIGLPSVTLAHVNRADDLRYPFGSVFWHNLARMTWSLARDKQGRLVLANRKANAYPYQGKYTLDEAPRLTIGGQRVGGFFAITRLHNDLAERIWEAFGEDDELTKAQIAQRLTDDGGDHVPDGSLRSVLSRSTQFVAGPANTWKRATTPATTGVSAGVDEAATTPATPTQQAPVNTRARRNTTRNAKATR